MALPPSAQKPSMGCHETRPTLTSPVSPPGTSSFKRRTIRASATSNASLPLSSPSSALYRNAKAPSCSRRTAFFCDSPVNATHRDPRRRRIVLQRLQHVRPRHLRQQHIQQDQVRLLFPRNLQRIRPIHRRADLVPRPRQRPLRCQPQKLAVIHQQNLRHSSLVLPHLVSNLGCFGSRHRGRNSVLVSTTFPIPYRQIFATNQQERTRRNPPDKSSLKFGGLSRPLALPEVRPAPFDPRSLPSVPAALPIAFLREPGRPLDQRFHRCPAGRAQLRLMPIWNRFRQQ